MRPVKSFTSWGRLRALLPIILFPVLMVILDCSVAPMLFHDPAAWLILIGNTLFVGVLSSVMAFFAGRNCTSSGRIQKSAHDELERRVEERTAELSVATELAKAERQRLFGVLETLPVYVCLLTPDYHMPFANRLFREWFGYQPTRKCYEFLFERSQPCEVCETYNVLKSNAPQHWEWTGPNGRNYDIYDFPFIDSDGSALILEMGIDITDRKLAEQELKRLNETLEQRIIQRTAELQQSQERLSTMYATMTEGLASHAIVYADGAAVDYVITDVNPAFESITGIPRAAAIGAKASQLYGAARAPYLDLYVRVAAGGKPETFETYFAPMNKYFAISVFSPGKGKFATVFSDISERRKAEEELRARNAELSEFNCLMVDRELRMIELKKEINELCRQSGRQPRYDESEEVPV